MRYLKRRDFLNLSLGATTAVLVSQCSRVSSRSAVSNAKTNTTQLCISKDGLLSLDLEASAQQLRLGNRTANVLTYNGQMPGPQLEARPGERYRFALPIGSSSRLTFTSTGCIFPPQGPGIMFF